MGTSVIESEDSLHHFARQSFGIGHYQQYSTTSTNNNNKNMRKSIHNNNSSSSSLSDHSPKNELPIWLQSENLPPDILSDDGTSPSTSPEKRNRSNTNKNNNDNNNIPSKRELPIWLQQEKELEQKPAAAPHRANVEVCYRYFSS